MARITLRPLDAADVEALAAAADHPACWEYMFAHGQGHDAMQEWVRSRLDAAGQGAQSWVVRVDGVVAGSSSLYDLRRQHDCASMGYTWLSRRYWGMGINGAVKHALLGYAFGELALRRVQFTVDARNQRSQAALERLGATREGVLRQERVLPGGYIRDTVVYSVLAGEWPTIQAKLPAPAQITPVHAPATPVGPVD